MIMDYYYRVFSQNLRILLADKKMSQKDLAKEIDVHESAISLLVHGKRLPTLPTYLKIVRFFGTSMEEMLMEKKHK